ncbi:MAG: ATP-binding protein [Thermoproteota archaeon]|nr:ATP-binding protein [Thermoproteota archaeon]
MDNTMRFTAVDKIIVSTSINVTDSYDKVLLSNPHENTVDKNNNNLKNNDEDIEKEYKNTNSIIVSILDTGIGINSHIKDQLFEKFATKSKQGTGLGLYLSKKIVEAHGGKIWFEDQILIIIQIITI